MLNYGSRIELRAFRIISKLSNHLTATFNKKPQYFYHFSLSEMLKSHILHVILTKYVLYTSFAENICSRHQHCIFDNLFICSQIYCRYVGINGAVFPELLGSGVIGVLS
jgi:hypothetical protein